MKSAYSWLFATIKSANSRRRTWRAIQLLVSILLLAWLVSRIDVRTATAVAGLPIGITVISLSIFTSAQVFSSLRLWLLLRRQKIDFPFFHLVRVTLIGFFTNNFLPSTVGGDLYKGIALTRSGHDLSTIVVTLVVDRILSLITIVVMTAAAVLFTDLWQLRPLRATNYFLEAFVLFSVAMLCFIVLSKPIVRLGRSRAPMLSARLGTRIKKISSLSFRFLASPSTLVLSVLFSILSTSAAIFAQLLIADALGIRISAIELTAVLGIATLLALIPISVNGIGVQEISLVALLQLMGAAEESAIVFAIFSRALIIGTSFFGGVLLLHSGRTARKTDR